MFGAMKFSVIQRWRNAGLSQGTTYPFQKNHQSFDSLACHCDQNHGPFHPFQTCTCLKTRAKVTSDHHEPSREQNRTSDLTWHSSSHVSSSKPSHAAHVIHAAKAPAAHSCQKQHWPLMSYLYTRPPPTLEPRRQQNPYLQACSYLHNLEHPYLQQKKKAQSGILCLMTEELFRSYLWHILRQRSGQMMDSENVSKHTAVKWFTH